MTPVMDIKELSDEELKAQARDWRKRALHGEKEARGMAHELEREVRRRFGRSENNAQLQLKEVPLLGELPQGSPQRWKPW